MVPKPDKSVRVCIDFRWLNEVSRFDAYHIPLVLGLLERLGTARYLSKLDLTKGYWQIPLTPASQEKTAFAIPQGLFHFTRMPFGLQWAAATFQRLMDKVLANHQDYAAAYINDVIICSQSWEQHVEDLEAVLGTLRQAGLTANPAKCALDLTQTQYI